LKVVIEDIKSALFAKNRDELKGQEIAKIKADFKEKILVMLKDDDTTNANLTKAGS